MKFVWIYHRIFFEKQSIRNMIDSSATYGQFCNCALHWVSCTQLACLHFEYQNLIWSAFSTASFFIYSRLRVTSVGHKLKILSLVITLSAIGNKLTTCVHNQEVSDCLKSRFGSVQQLSILAWVKHGGVCLSTSWSYLPMPVEDCVGHSG